MLKRIKRIWELSKIDGIEDVDTVELKSSGKQIQLAKATEPIGDGQAVFLPDMTEQEYEEYLKDEVNGWKKFKKKLGL